MQIGLSEGSDYPEKVIVGDREYYPRILLTQEPKKVTLYQFLVERNDRLIYITDWSTDEAEKRVSSPNFKILKTFTREIEY